MNGGFAKSYRDKWSNPIFRNLLEAAIWSWMCDTAAWKDTRIRFNGELINLKRGQLITSRGFMANGFCVGEQVIRTFLDNIEHDGMINQLATRRGTIITICNYEKYQGIDFDDNQQTNQPPTSSQPAANHNKKEYKNIRTKESNIITLELLSVDHISEWLAKKRAEGKYIHHDEVFILERFKDYCLSKGKKYNDYIAAYRNAFEWDSCQPQQPKRGDPATNAYNAAQSIIARRNAAAAISEGTEPANDTTTANLRLPENLR
jgi:hypothetical protein